MFKNLLFILNLMSINFETHNFVYPIVFAHVFGPISIFILILPCFSIIFCLCLRIIGQQYIKYFSISCLVLTNFLVLCLLYTIGVFNIFYHIKIFT